MPLLSGSISCKVMKKRKRNRQRRLKAADKKQQKKLVSPDNMGTMFSSRYYQTFRIPQVTSILDYLCPNVIRRRVKLVFAAMFGFAVCLALRFRRRKRPGLLDEPVSVDNDSNSVQTTETEAEGEEPYVPHHEDQPVPGQSAAGSCIPGPAVDSSERPKTEENDDEEEEDEFDSSEYVVDRSDDLYCEYDSTWESSSPSHPRRDDRRRVFRSYKFDRFENAARDMQNYRHDYPLKSRQIWNQGSGMPNLEFYLGKRPSSPDGVYIHEFHTKWYKSYERLERVHTWVQWLFPLQEKGVNYQAPELTKEEVEAFCVNNTAKMNLLASYKLMLDFYGIELCNEETGEVKKARNWKERFSNLNHNTHNSLRITRILKCLGTLGFTHYQVPLVRFFLEETLIHGELPNVKQSVLSYFMFAVRDKKKRRRLVKFAYMNYDCKDEFVWCPKKIQMIWSKKPGSPYSSQPMGIMTQQGDDGTYHHDARSQNVYRHDGSPARVTSTADPESSLYQKESTVPVTSPWYKQSTSQTNRHVDSSAKAQSPDSLADLDQQTTPGSNLANSSLDYGNQMSDDRHHGEAVKIDIPPSDGDLTAEKKSCSDEEPMDTCSY